MFHSLVVIVVDCKLSMGAGGVGSGKKKIKHVIKALISVRKIYFFFDK